MHGSKYITQYRTFGNSLGSAIRIGGDPVNAFQQNTYRPSQGKVHPVYVNSYKPDHGIRTFIKKFGGK